MKRGIYTFILESRKIGNLEIFREDNRGYPMDKSNVYAKNTNGEIIWFSEVVEKGDNYPNQILWNKCLNKKATSWETLFDDCEESFCVSSGNGFTVCISNLTGTIIDKEFTK